MPRRTAAGPLPASPASGGGESEAAAPASLLSPSMRPAAFLPSGLRRPPCHPLPTVEAAAPSPFPLAGGIGGGPPGGEAIPHRTAADPLPASPASGGGENKAAVPSSPFRPSVRAAAFFTPACGSRPSSPLPLAGGVGGGPPDGETIPHRAAADPLPASPARGEGRNKRSGYSIICLSAQREAGRLLPSRLREGLGGGPPDAAGPCRTARPLAPKPAFPRKRRRRKRAGCSGIPLRAQNEAGRFLPSRRRRPPRQPPSRLREGLEKGLPTARLYHAARPLPPSPPPPQAGEEKARGPLHQPPFCPVRGRPPSSLPLAETAAPSLAACGGRRVIPPPACGRGWGRAARRRGHAAPRGRRPLPGLPCKRGRRKLGGCSIIRLSAQREANRFSPFRPAEAATHPLPACGRGWGRAARRRDHAAPHGR